MKLQIMSFLARAEALDFRLEMNIERINQRLRTLDQQMGVVDRILAGLDNNNNTVPNTQSDDESEWDHYSLTDSDFSISTAEYDTPDIARMEDFDEFDDDDDETVVGDWEDPFLTPERRIIIPMDLEQGLEMLG